jgi:hypothetical protein
MLIMNMLEQVVVPVVLPQDLLFHFFLQVL